MNCAQVGIRVWRWGKLVGVTQGKPLRKECMSVCVGVCLYVWFVSMPTCTPVPVILVLQLKCYCFASVYQCHHKRLEARGWLDIKNNFVILFNLYVQWFLPRHVYCWGGLNHPGSGLGPDAGIFFPPLSLMSFDCEHFSTILLICQRAMHGSWWQKSSSYL